MSGTDATSAALRRVLVVDDESPARKRLRELLADCRSDGSPIEVVGEAADGLAALALLNEEHVDILLLDIRMPGMDGVELARHARKLAAPPAVIFTTAFDNYAVQAFELNAVDYLLKPIRRERLAVALQRAMAASAPDAERLARLPTRVRGHLSIVERGRVVLVPVNEVLYLRAELKYVTVRTAAREFLLEESLSSLEKEFGDHFVRIHRNCIVRREAIAGFEREAGGDGDGHWVTLLHGSDERLPVSRRQQHIVKAL